MYRHLFVDGQDSQLPIGKVVCIGRNYADHVRELNNPTPSSPVLFIKPREAICDMHLPIKIPTTSGECHNELEVALLIDKPLTACDAQSGLDAVVGIGLGLDLTLRDVQTELKQSGHPWERAKAFDNSCPLSKFVRSGVFENWQNIEFQLTVNDQCQQQGSTANMLFSIADLLCEVTRSFTLNPGDVVLTGTPKGVGPLHIGDRLTTKLADKLSVTTSIIK